MTQLRVATRLPAVWPMPRGAILQGNLPVNGGRLRAKVFVFDTLGNMRAWWKERIGHSIAGASAAVNNLSTYRVAVAQDGSGRERRFIDVDERYFCVMGFSRRHLDARVVSHESVHAGFAFARRRARSWWDAAAIDFDEEAVAYPAGEICNGLAGMLRALEE